MGYVIGSGIFRVPSSVAAEVGAPGAMLLVWLIGGIVSLCGALTLAELATMFPRPGGVYVHLLEGFGRLPAFLYGWARLVVIAPSSLGAMAVIFAAYSSTFLAVGDDGVRVVAIALLVLLAAVNYRSVGLGAAVENVSTAGKVLALVGFSLLVFALGDPAGGALGRVSLLGPESWTGFGVALITVFWSYSGWASVTAMAGEIRDPGRTVPRAFLAGMLAVIAIYMTVNAAYMFALPEDAIAGSAMVAADTALRVFGAAGAAVVAALVMLSTFGSLNASIMTGPRIFFAMAEDRLFFHPICAVHPRYATPHRAIILSLALGIAYVSSQTFEQLAQAFVLGAWPFYILAAAAVIRLRRTRPELPRPYRTLGYPVVPLIFILGSLGVMLSAAIRRPGPSLFALGVIVAGIPVYYVWRAWTARTGERAR